MRSLWLAGLAASAAAAGAADVPPPVPIEALAQVPFISDPELSPDGKHLAARINADGKEVLALYDTDAPRDAPPRIVQRGGGARWFGWAGNDRLLVGNTLISLMLGTLPFQITRLSSYDLKTGKTSDVKVGNGFMGDNVIFTDPQGRYVLISAQKDWDDSPSVWRVDLATGASIEVQRKKADIWSWFVDEGGNVRGGISYRPNGWTIYRKDSAGELKRAAAGRFPEKGETAIDSIGLLQGGDTGVIVTNERTGRFAVYRYDLGAQAIGAPIFEHPEADVTKPQISPDGRTVEGVYFEADLPQVAWLTPELKQIQAQVDRTFPGKVNRIMNPSRERNRAIILSGSADDPGIYYIFDRQARRMEAFAAPYDDLVDRRMSPVKPVRYAARDGLSIRAYLTLPVGRDPRGLPLILFPHGGPFARTSYEFDPIVQLLASRGYAVLQPNFRGSTGFGRDFVEQGYGEWGRKMQDDLDDGVAWLAGRGIIDRKRVCIVGASYGGYAALWGAIRNPDIYRCAVSFAGVTDLRAMLKFDARSMVASRYSKMWRRRVEGEEKRDLASVSPLQQAARLNIPVLIGHGELDDNVPVDQSRQLVRALRARAAPVQAVFYRQAGHGFTRTEDRMDYMKRLEAFLEVHNPADGATGKGPREPQLVAGAPTAAAIVLDLRKSPKNNSMELRYRVAQDGRGTSCTVPGSSGVEALDRKACEIVETLLQYRPALDAAGRPKEAWVTYKVVFDADAKVK
jgi:dipeptidyl aminopeptidase/acylaminoacyl peptidase